MQQNKIELTAFKFLKSILYKSYTERRYTKYKLQFPKLRESQIISKTLKQWDAEYVHNFFTIFKLIKKQDPDLLRNLKQTKNRWPYFHIWKKSADSSQDEMPVEQLENWNRKKRKNRECTKIQNEILAYDLVQKMVGEQLESCQFSKKAYRFQQQAFKIMMKNGKINQQQFIHQTNICRRIPIDDDQIQIPEEERILFKLFTPKTRCFEQKISKIEKNMDEQYEENVEQKQLKRQREYKNPKPKQIFQEIEQCQNKFVQKKFRNKLKKLIKKGQKVAQKTYMKRNGKRYHYCLQCDKCIRIKTEHHCKRIEIENDSQKKARPWFLPAFSTSKKLFGFCLFCKNYGQSHKHSQISPISSFSLFPKQMQFKIQGESFFDNVILISEHFTSPHIKSDQISFYQKGHIGSIPQMNESNEKIFLTSNCILTSVKQIQQNRIFGPIALDALPSQVSGHLPWQAEYFSNIVNLGGITFVLCPLYRMNGLAFIINEKKSTSLPNIDVFIGAHDNKIKLFAKAIRKIHAGEEIVIRNVQKQ